MTHWMFLKEIVDNFYVLFKKTWSVSFFFFCFDRVFFLFATGVPRCGSPLCFPVVLPQVFGVEVREPRLRVTPPRARALAAHNFRHETLEIFPKPWRFSRNLGDRPKTLEIVAIFFLRYIYIYILFK